MSDEVLLEVPPAPRFERSQVALRLAVVLGLSVLGAPIAWGFGALYLLLPVIAAIVISSRGPSGYFESEGRRVVEILRWWTALVGYLSFVTDRFPLQKADYDNVRISTLGAPNATVGVALLRLLTSLPVALVLVPLWWLAGLLLVVAVVTVLLSERVPEPLLRYFAFVTTLQARLLVYHAALTDRHPFVEQTRAHAAS
jgi:hypothetical protein